MKLALYGILTVVCFSQFTCEQQDCGCVAPPKCSGCGLQATVRDFTGLDGCGIGLELADGSVLMPERRVYVQAPKPEEDPAYYFDFVPGEKVCIEYNELEQMTYCMKGKNVFLTCIKKVSANNQGD